MRRLLAVSAALFLSLLGCDATPVQDSESPVAAATKIEDRSTIPQVFIAPDGTERIRRIPGVVEYIHYPDDVMLPAHRTAAEYIVQKGDAYDDLRYAAPERHALTIPPVKAVRPMVEWEPMQAIMMGVPSYVLSAGSSNTLDTVVQIAKNAATVAQVWFVVPNTASKNSLEGALLAAGMSQQLITSQVRYMIQAIDSIWFIDYGPLPVLDTAAQTWSFVDFRYYHQRALDDGMPSWIGRNLSGIGVASNVNTYRMPVNIEGGTFQATTDGICFTGTRALTSTDCGANGCTSNLEFLSLAQVQQTGEAQLLRSTWGQYAGCKDLITMYSITDDGTGHIDMFLKVLDDETVLMADYRAPYANTAQQTNAARMNANAAFLEAYVKPNGKKFKVKRIIMPGHREGTPFTYANSTLINGLNLWPAFTFSDWVSSRNTAEAEWEAALPDYQHIWIDSEELSFNSGAIHCITRTIPATAAAKWIADGSCSGDTCVAPANGYSGDCTPNGIASQVCYGPQWLCGCNDCDSACPGSGGTNDACGAVTLVGCCDGSNLKYCENNALGGLVCTNGCGWNATSSWYDCGYTGSDPSGNNPRSCSPVVCTPNCSGKTCGADGCGGSCGNCASGQTCTSGTCVTPVDPCGGITFEGCCVNKTTLKWCENGVVNQNTCNAGTCGWEALSGFYNCDTAGEADPSGVNPQSCDALTCTPQCAGKSCGSDGCGGSCGSCSIFSACDASFQCVPFCTPSCSGKTCGSDGCGGSCGTCGATSTCSAGGVCVANCAPSCSGKTCGADGCGGSCGTCAVGESCTANQCVAGCAPSCTGKACGPDGCGGSCGTCSVGSSCNASGICVAGCAPSCTGKACGPDGCGGSCGTCSVGSSCNASGICVAGCAPSCTDKVCGPDGCGGSCGTCSVGQTCTAAGKCLANCVPQCTGKACGDDGCGGSCGTCGAGQSCTAAGKCAAGCAPSCGGKSCGDDGCGGSCGSCASGETCSAGKCEAACAPLCVGMECGDDGCGGACGSCAGGSSCQEGKCVVDCAPDCAGKSCGDDGCGGTCGACASGKVCDGAKCVAEVCVPACEGKSCGTNGCGGSCGACGDGETCATGQCQAVAGCGDVTAEGLCDGSVVTWCQSDSLKSFDCADQGRICGLKDGVGSTCLDPCVADCSGKQCGDDGCGGECGSCPPGQECNAGACGDGPGPDAAPDSGGDTATPDAAADAGGETAGTPDADGGTPETTGTDADAGNGEVEVTKPVTGTGPSGCAGGGADGSGGWLGLLALLGLGLAARRRRGPSAA
jgi:agmatine/peptidylarginine deiminase